MTDVARQLQRSSFDGIAFACFRYRVMGGLREHVHEYLHTPGGDPESLGRKLYEFEFDALFSTNSPSYPDAWPGDLSDLRDRFEREVISDLVVPSLGTIKARCINWPTEFDFQKRRDGETAKLTFREASTNELVVGNVVQVQPGALKPALDAALVLAEEAGLGDLFSSVKKMVGDIQGLRGRYEMQAEILQAKVVSTIAACQELDESIKELANPLNYKLAEAVIELGWLAIQIHKDLLRSALPIIPYVVPTTMSIFEVSSAIYGNADRGLEILKINAIDDAFAIPSGTLLRVYAPSPI